MGLLQMIGLSRRKKVAPDEVIKSLLLELRPFLEKLRELESNLPNLTVLGAFAQLFVIVENFSPQNLDEYKEKLQELSTPATARAAMYLDLLRRDLQSIRGLHVQCAANSHGAEAHLIHHLSSSMNFIRLIQDALHKEIKAA